MKRRTNQQVTIRDVAQAARVSQSTVSLVLNNRPSVGQETRKRVMTAITNLDYRPSRAAQAVVTKKSKNVGILELVTAHDGPQAMVEKYGFATMIPTFAHDVARGIEEEAQRRGYGLLFTTYYGQLSESWKKLPPMILQQWVDGLLLVGGTFPDSFIRMLREWRIPLVLVGGHSPSDLADCVYADSSTGVARAVDYLVGLGFSKIGFINGPPTTQTSSDKMKGYLLALQANGLQFDGTLVAEGDFSAQSGYEATRQLLSHHPDLRAILVGFDGMALGTKKALSEKGLRVPEDVSLISYEDSWITTHFEPPLTAIKVFKYEIGSAAANMLFELMTTGQRTRPRKMIIPTELIVRESCRSQAGGRRTIK